MAPSSPTPPACFHRRNICGSQASIGRHSRQPPTVWQPVGERQICQLNCWRGCQRRELTYAHATASPTLDRPDGGMPQWDWPGSSAVWSSTVPGRADTVTRLRGAQAAFERYDLELALPPHLNYMVGVGLTSIPVTEQLVARIRERIANPVRAAALATILFTGATYRELTYLPQDTVVGDTMVFRTTRVVAHPTDLGVWVIPASIRPLLRAATLFHHSRADREEPHLFADAIGNTGALHLLARLCGVTIPALHPWHHGWLRSTVALNLVGCYECRDTVPR